MITFTNLGKLGRMSNQLFQCAATIALALRNNDDFILPHWDIAEHFSISPSNFSHNIQSTNRYSEPYYHYAKIPCADTKHQILDLNGYFQSYKYFEDYSDIILSLLTPKSTHGMKFGYTGIHVRRGDYLHLTKEYEQLDMNYYNKAMDILKSNYYIVFSDDINWCKANFKGDNIIFSENQSPIEDLKLLIACENQVIANSSFSWWGAYLNKNPSKIVIAPNKWFGLALPHNTQDLLPSNWIKI